MSLTILYFVPPNFLLGVSLKPHPPLAEFNGVHFLDPGDFWIWLSNSGNGIQKKRQVRQLSFVATALQKCYVLVCADRISASRPRNREQESYALGLER